MYEESEEDEEYHAYEYDGGSEGDSCDCDCDDGTAVWWCCCCWIVFTQTSPLLPETGRQLPTSPAFPEAFGAHVTLRTCHRWVPQRPLWQGLVLNLGPLTVVLSTTWHEFKPQKMPRWACEQHWYGHISLQNTYIYIIYTIHTYDHVYIYIYT